MPKESESEWKTWREEQWRLLIRVSRRERIRPFAACQWKQVQQMSVSVLLFFRSMEELLSWRQCRVVLHVDKSLMTSQNRERERKHALYAFVSTSMSCCCWWWWNEFSPSHWSTSDIIAGRFISKKTITRSEIRWRDETGSWSDVSTFVE